MRRSPLPGTLQCQPQPSRRVRTSTARMAPANEPQLIGSNIEPRAKGHGPWMLYSPSAASRSSLPFTIPLNGTRGPRLRLLSDRGRPEKGGEGTCRRDANLNLRCPFPLAQSCLRLFSLGQEQKSIYCLSYISFLW